MFDNNQVIETKDLASAIKSLAALSIKPEQLEKKEITDIHSIKHYVSPGLISRISDITLYGTPTQRSGSNIVYINGDTFQIDLPPSDLAIQLGIRASS